MEGDWTANTFLFINKPCRKNVHKENEMQIKIHKLTRTGIFIQIRSKQVQSCTSVLNSRKERRVRRCQLKEGLETGETGGRENDRSIRGYLMEDARDEQNTQNSCRTKSILCRCFIPRWNRRIRSPNTTSVGWPKTVRPVLTTSSDGPFFTDDRALARHIVPGLVTKSCFRDGPGGQDPTLTH